MRIRYRVTTEVIYEADIGGATEAEAKSRVEDGDILNPREVGYWHERTLMETAIPPAELSPHCN